MMTKQEQNDVSLRQVFLPFYELNSKRAGWQFGMPKATTLKGVKARLAERAGLSILKLYDNGDITKVVSPLLDNPHERIENNTEPPIPQWAWVPVQLENEEKVQYARVVAPKRDYGSVPIVGLNSRKHGKVLYTKEGLKEYQQSGTLYDAPFDIGISLKSCNIPEATEKVEIEFNLGVTKIADLGIRINSKDRTEGILLFLRPTEFAFDNELWSCHLFRAVTVYSLGK